MISKGYFPNLTAKQVHDLTINNGFFDDLGDSIRDAFGGSDDNFNDGDGFTAGGRGSTIAEREKSNLDKGIQTAFTGAVGGVLGVPGLTSLVGDTDQIDLTTGRRVGSTGGTASTDTPDSRDAAIASILQTGSGTINANGSSVPVTVNEAGQLVDNSGNIVNQAGQRLDADGRVLSDADIAIQRALGFQEEASQNALDFLTGGAERARLAAAQGSAGGEDILREGSRLASRLLTEGAGRAQGFLQTQADRGITGIEDQLAITQGRLDPFREAGVSALEREQAALGVLGPEAQQRFFEEQTLSPAQRFLEQQQEQASLRNAAATGGVGGGRQQIALQELASGRASTILENQLDRLSSLSVRGQQAAGTQGQFGQAAQSEISQLLAQLGGRQAGVETGLSRDFGNIATSLGSNIANLRGTEAAQRIGIETGLSGQQANIAAGTGENQAAAVLGQQVADAQAQSEANRIAALQAQQESQQDAALQSSLLGLAGTIATPFISSLF